MMQTRREVRNTTGNTKEPTECKSLDIGLYYWVSLEYIYVLTVSMHV